MCLCTVGRFTQTHRVLAYSLARKNAAQRCAMRISSVSRLGGRGNTLHFSAPPPTRGCLELGCTVARGVYYFRLRAGLQNCSEAHASGRKVFQVCPRLYLAMCDLTFAATIRQEPLGAWSTLRNLDLASGARGSLRITPAIYFRATGAECPPSMADRHSDKDMEHTTPKRKTITKSVPSAPAAGQVLSASGAGRAERLPPPVRALGRWSQRVTAGSTLRATRGIASVDANP